MRDLESIINENNQAALDYLMRGLKYQKLVEAKPKGGWALTVLAQKLKHGPPDIRSISNFLQNINVMHKFAVLVNAFLPEYKKEIMAEPIVSRVYKFNEYFSKKYYPLPVMSNCQIWEFVEGLPVDLMGLSYNSYHSLNMRPGYLLLLSLVSYPFLGDGRDEIDDDIPIDLHNLTSTKYKPTKYHIEWLRTTLDSLSIDGTWMAPLGYPDGKMGFTIKKISKNEIELSGAVDDEGVKETIACTQVIADKLGIKVRQSSIGRTADEKESGPRIPLLDMVQGIVGIEVSGDIPVNGWSPEILHKITDGSRFDGVGDFADWAFGQTGLVLLDSNYEGCDYEYAGTHPVFIWSEYNVERLTKDHPGVLQYRMKIDHLVEWLELDPINNFRDMLRYILADPLSKESQLIVREDDSYCVLNQEYENEEEELEEDGRGQLVANL
ncbi:MAG: hypothetical protein PHF95_05880 [bacterium]|nr:hypothetical protein [bacterium]